MKAPPKRIWLYAFDDGRAVAWSEDGIHFFDAASGQLVARRDEDWLIAADSGSPLGWVDRAGVYDPEGRRVFFLG